MRHLNRRTFLAALASAPAWIDSSRAGSAGPANGEGASVKGAARWLEQSEFIASSLETGRIGYLEAWGGDEFGYSYTYSLADQPRGVSVDTATGMLSLAAPLNLGVHRFQAIVANRKVPAKTARFAVTLLVRQGVTANRVDDQILHKTYVVDSGDYGLPRGQDYTQVLMRLRRAILSDQIAAGDGNLRATVLFHRGKLYDYTNNRWPVGIQYLTVACDPHQNPGGPRPRMRNVKATFIIDAEIAILICGGGSAFSVLPDRIKKYSPLIHTAEPGADMVRLKNRLDSRYVRVGRWHLVASYDQQVEGYPPNIRYYDYVRVIAVSGDTVVLDRRLRHLHREDYFEIPSNPVSIGAARIIPMDLGGSGGLLPSSDARLTIRQTFRDIEFVPNPSAVLLPTDESNRAIYIAESLDTSFEDCVMPHPVPTVVRHMRFLRGIIEDSEADKIISMLIADGVRSGEILGATGVELYLMRNSTSAPLQISPRQLRVIDSAIDATRDRIIWYPITWAYNGPILSVELHGTTLRINPTNNDTRVMPAVKPALLTLGRDATWIGDRLTIPSNSAIFFDWQVWLFEGMIVYVTRSSWGVVRQLSSAPDGGAVWADIQWMAGTKPADGQLNTIRGHSLSIDDECKLEGRASWDAECGGFMRQKLPSFLRGGSYDFPAGYPAGEYGF